MRTIFKFLIACFNFYRPKEKEAGKKIKYNIKCEDVQCFTFLSIVFFICFRLIAMMFYRDSVLERTKLTIDNRNDTIRDEIREKINNIGCLMFSSIKPYDDKFWFNEEQINYLNRKEKK